MGGFRVLIRAGGWQVTNGIEQHGPYPTQEQAVRTADNLNLQRRAAEARSFAPVSVPTNVQGGEALSEAQHRIASLIQTGELRDAHLTSKSDGSDVVVHGSEPAVLAPQMVSETRGSEPDGPIADVMAYPDGPSVWEAVEDETLRASADEDAAAEEAIERARVAGTDSAAAGSASRGGGLV